MSHHANTSNDDSDWFVQDEDEIMQNLQSKGNISAAQDSTEYITCPQSIALEEDDSTKYEPPLTSASTTAKISISTLRKTAHQEPLDAFLFAFTQEPNFFAGQITYNDKQERVLLYTRILALICELEMPGFHVDLLRSFAANQELLEHFLIIATKLFSERYKSMWTDEKRVDEIVHDMQTLLLQSHQVGVLSPKGFEVMQHIRKIILASDASHIAQRPACLELAQHLERILNVDTETMEICDKAKALDEIYPSLEELLQACDDMETAATCDEIPYRGDYKSVTDYITVQKHLLREDFMIPLRTCVNTLKKTRTLCTFSHQTFHLNGVQIVLNDQFIKAHRHEMLFVDVLGSNRDESVQKPRIPEIEQCEMNKLKTGALLLLTTNYEFENLILATVTYTDLDMLRAGYIGIEIVRQYNIGNIYNKSLIAFETPAFFEPYHNVYNFLSTCSVADFPMKDHIVFGATNAKIPDYLTKDITYTYYKHKFKPLHEPPPQKLTLNSTQLSAYSNALKENFSLIQGPPGTGKTHLSIHLAKTLIENGHTPLVVITYTNESLDKFLLKLADFTTSIVRFGGQTRQNEISKYNIQNIRGDKYLVNPQLKRLHYVIDLEFKEKFQRLQTLQTEFDGTEESYQQILAAQHELRAVACKLQTIRILFQYYLVRKESVIAMTTTCAAKTNFLFRLLKSSVVIFEEAAEILESHVVACLTPFTKHVIMIGDHQQLQPYTTSFQHSRSCQMNVSLFERMIRHNMKASVLKIQYRMRSSIAELICPVIYEELHNDQSVESYPLVRKMSKNVYFLTHNHEESKPEHSVSNKFEIDQITSLAKYLIIKAGYTAEDIVVISPYAKQVERIKNQFMKCEELEQIRAATVDSFQGLEANIVLLSLVRSNQHGQIGFLKEKNRICVALSRAKQGLYIIGNLDLLEACSSTWCAIRETLNAQDAIGNEFPYMLRNSF